jgi:hypothetical protein
MTSLALSHLPPGSPLWLYVFVASALALHIAAGSVAILAGYTAILARKGGLLHRRAGLAFIAAMVVMGAMGSVLASRIPDRANIAAGILAAYLVSTAWMTVRRRPLCTGRFERIAFVGVAALALFYVVSGIQAQLAPSHRLDHYPPGPFFAVGALAAFFAWGDWRMLRRGGVEGTGRLARHIGRMGFALFLAAASFFIGQQKVMPVFMHGWLILFALGFAPLALTLFWLVKIRLPKRRRLAPA